MNLILIAILAAGVAFFVGLVLGICFQTNKCKGVVYNALGDANTELNHIEFLSNKSTDWVIGRNEAQKTILEHINSTFWDD